LSSNNDTRKHVNDFLVRLFTMGGYCEELFRKLCREGCSDEELAGLLFAVCTIAVADRSGLIDLGKISMPQVRRLAKDLQSLAGLVRRVNETSLNPKLDILAAPTDVSRDPVRKYIARLYDMLPETMMVYSVHLDQDCPSSGSRFGELFRTMVRWLALGGIGHNLPQEAPEAFAKAVIDVDSF
jgi:hypothetical protein